MSSSKTNILLVENDKTFRCLVAKELSPASDKANYFLETAASPQESFRKLNSSEIDIVLLGIDDTQGLEALGLFCKTYPDIPVIVLAGLLEKKIAVAAIQKGASAFLSKDQINKETLYRTISHSLERHHIQLQLKKEKQLLRDYLELADIIVVEIDVNQQIRMINDSGCKILGLTEDELIGLNWFDTFSPAGKAETLKHNFDKMIKSGFNKAAFESIVAARGRHSKIVSWKTKPIRDKAGSIISVLGSGTDVTATKAGRARLRKINKQVIAHDRQKSEFVINISHELRTPLTIFKNILSNALAGTSGKISSKLTKELKIANSAVDRLSGIITDFLDISRIEAGKMNLDFEELHIQSIIKESIGLLSPVIQSNYMTVNLSMPKEPLYISADRGMIIQIMSKLIENAAKFVPDCGGLMIIRLIDKNHKIEINVEDNGNGIQGEDINLVFDKFIQIERHVGEGEHGTGLGLAITKELVEMHGGHIWVENISHGGANFRIEFPKSIPVSDKKNMQDNTDINKSVDSVKYQIQELNDLCQETFNNRKQNKPVKENNKMCPVNWKLAIRYCGDEDVVERIAETIIQNCPGYLSSLIESANRCNRADSVYYAHKLRGSIITLGVSELAKKAEQAEIAAGEEDFKTLQKIIPEITSQYKHLESFLKKIDWIQTAKNSAVNAEH